MESIGRIWDGLCIGGESLSAYEGAYAAHGIDKNGVIGFPCSVCIQAWFPEQVMFRAHRLWKQVRHRKVSKLREKHLGEEAIIIFGPEVSPGRAIGFLEEMIADIKKHGLYIGKVEGGDDYFREKLAGKILDEKEQEVNLGKYKPKR